MANGSRDPFGYSEKSVGRTVQNVTSDMWEPISSGAPVRKDTPERKSTSVNTRSAANTKSATKPSQNKKNQGKRTAAADVTKDRISAGGQQKKSTSQPKKRQPEKNTRAVGTKKREPKGKDTRAYAKHREQAAQQKNRQRAKNLNRSRLEYNEQLKSGRSHDDIRKRTSKKKRRKRKLITFVTVFIMLLLVSGFAFSYAYTKGAPVSVIAVEGESKYKNEKIIETANLYSGINMLSVREKTVNDAVTKALPYIKSVEVDYQLPDTLLLRVTSTQDRLMITNGTGCICVDSDDKILSVKKKKLTEGRYLIEGLEEQGAIPGEIYVPCENNLEKYNKAKEIVSVLEDNESFKSGVVDVSNLSDVKVTYESRIRIYLGECEDLENQLNLAIQVIGEGASEGQTGYIDVRFGNKAYLALGSMEIK